MVPLRNPFHSLFIVWTPPPLFKGGGGSKFCLPPLDERESGKIKKGGRRMVLEQVFLKSGGADTSV